MSAILETFADTGQTQGEHFEHFGDTGQTHPTCPPDVSKLFLMCPPCSCPTSSILYNHSFCGTPYSSVEHIGARLGKVRTVLTYGQSNIFLWSEGVLTDMAGATLRTISFSMCAGTVLLLISIGLRVPLHQSDCIVSARSSEWVPNECQVSASWEIFGDTGQTL